MRWDINDYLNHEDTQRKEQSREKIQRRTRRKWKRERKEQTTQTCQQPELLEIQKRVQQKELQARIQRLQNISKEVRVLVEEIVKISNMLELDANHLMQRLWNLQKREEIVKKLLYETLKSLRTANWRKPILAIPIEAIYNWGDKEKK